LAKFAGLFAFAGGGRRDVFAKFRVGGTTRYAGCIDAFGPAGAPGGLDETQKELGTHES